MSQNGTISPLELEAMLRIGSMDQDQALLARQLAQVDALRGPAPEHHTAIGGGLGAIAQTLDGYTANQREKAAYGQAQQLKGNQQDAMRAMIAALKGEPGVSPPQAPPGQVLGLNPNIS